MTLKEQLKQKIQALISQIEALKALLASKKEPKKDYQAFCRAIRERESGNNYTIVNKFGYLGAYQFGMARLCDLGYTERIPGTTGFANKCFRWKPPYTQEKFLGDSDVQDQIFREHVLDLARTIKKKFRDYLIGNICVSGIVITLSGCVAGAHLGGVGGLRKFLTSGISPEDGFGTPVEYYVEKFANYDLEV